MLSPSCLPFHHPGRNDSCKRERKTGLEPATLTLARLCSTNWAIFASCYFCLLPQLAEHLVYTLWQLSYFRIVFWSVPQTECKYTMFFNICKGFSKLFLSFFMCWMIPVKKRRFVYESPLIIKCWLPKLSQFLVSGLFRYPYHHKTWIEENRAIVKVQICIPARIYFSISIFAIQHL